MSLLYDTYLNEEGRHLHSVATGQHLSVVRDQGDRVRFAYEDALVSLDIDVELLGPGKWQGPTALFDWNNPMMSEARQSYGLWRRTTWFMLDALLVWLIKADRPQRTVASIGAWLNGAWRTRGCLQSSWFNGGTHRDKLAEPVLPYAVYPLDGPAPNWRFEPGLQGAEEGRIATIELDGRQQADLSIAIAEQLANVPRFVASDGTIYFFHRVTPFGGPEYSPTIRHGIATLDYAWYIFKHGAVDGELIPLRAFSDIPQPLLKQHSGEHRLHPILREAQFFAGAEAAALSFDTPFEALPKMRAIERNVTMEFHVGVDRINDPPMSVGLPSTMLSSWPVLHFDSYKPTRNYPMGNQRPRLPGWMARLASIARP